MKTDTQTRVLQSQTGLMDSITRYLPLTISQHTKIKQRRML